MADLDLAFRPMYAVPPGDTLKEVLADRGMSQTELASRMGRPLKTVNEIVKGKAAITSETAVQLERVLGVAASFWNNLERQYREDLARVREAAALEGSGSWLDRFPVADLKKLGYLPDTRDRVTLIHYLLRFFGVGSIEAWKSTWLRYDAAFRQSQVHAASTEATAAWLRAGELEARQIECAPYDRSAFVSFLVEARWLTREDPDVFYGPLVEGCRSAGVAVVFLGPLKGTRAWGAVRWVQPAKAMIQLSNRYRTDDHLWFTFFHEAGHIVLHSHREVFMEGSDVTAAVGDAAEDEANRFARDSLIPLERWQGFVGTDPRTLQAVEHFADAVGVSPGVVVGRLQHEGVWPFTHGNKLKRRFVLSTS